MEKKRVRVLVVDDELRNTKLVEAILSREGYDVVSAANGREALEAVASLHPDLILLDVMMPDMSGFEVAAELKRRPDATGIPIVMVTSLDDRTSKLRALDSGAEEFLTKPIDRAELLVRTRNLLRLKSYADIHANYARVLEVQVIERSRKLTDSYRDTIAALNRAASYRDEETGAHVQRISYYCTELAEALGMDAEFRECIYYASPMHDLGKIAIPDRILLKPGRLYAAEWETMKTHTTLGAKMIEGVDSPYLDMGRRIARSHHERYDGTGYPEGLHGEAIPLPARLMCIADVYDALRSRRPYKQAIAHDDSLRVITHGDMRTSPRQFDPDVLAAFVRLHRRMDEIFNEHVDPAAEKAA